METSPVPETSTASESNDSVATTKGTTMKPFRVWVLPLIRACRVRVDGIRNTAWLLNRLSHSFVFKSSEPVREEQGSSCCSFRVLYSSQMSDLRFKRLLVAIPEVEVISDLA